MDFKSYISSPMYPSFGTAPQSAVPTIGSIGATGYNYGYTPNFNGGYYSNQYGIYNPYAIREQQRQEEERRKKEQENRFIIQKMVSRCANSYYGEEISDETFDDMRNKYIETYNKEVELANEIQEYNEMQNLVANLDPNYISSFYINRQAYQANISAKYHQRDPDDEDLFTFLEKAGGLYQDILIEESNKRSKNLGQLYDKNGYTTLINKHSGKYDALSPNFGINSIDDMEITLPPHLKTSEYAKKKQAFLNAILAKE